MVHTWYHIAKAEYFVLTSGRRKHRNLFAAAVFTVAAFWAVVVAPMIVERVIGVAFPLPLVRSILMAIFPGLMRGAMLYLWAMLLLYPLSSGLQEVKIGQWEIMLSHNVKTRDILIGTYLGRIPLYGILVLFLAPILIAPFMLAFEVTLLGQILVYTMVALMVFSTVWLSSFVVAVLQARLGQSSRGTDIAKALAVVTALAAILPMYALIYYLPSFSEILGMNVFLLMPFAWTADLVSWISIVSNGIGLTESQIMAFSSVLKIDAVTSAVLMGAFGLAWVIVAVASADRVFSIGAGARTEKITKVGRENILLRGIRRLSKGPFGALIAVSLKSFGRKAENLSKVFYGIVLATLYPVMLWQLQKGSPDILALVLTADIMIGIMCVFPFAGTGFLESKDQLWMIQSAPRGGSQFMRARLVSGLLIALPIGLVPSIVVGLTFGIDVLFLPLFLVSAYLVVWGSVMVSMGITALYPNYEDTKSRAYASVVLSSMMLTGLSVIVPLLLGMFGFVAGFALFDFLKSNLGTIGFDFFMVFTGPLCLLLVGALMMKLGIRNLSRPQA